ncbi:MAG TPA: UvrD-helicase domain-containing protein, partial [Planctomycetota bacterium]|nr:UvrD-helicase domain-containing protein [Planctomycetota bacterium]
MSVRRSESPHLVIAASAGSGKTFQLTSRYIRLVLEGVRPDRILASTFTRKAAAEILARVLSRIAKGALDEAGAAKLASEVQTDASRDDALAALGRLTRNLHRLQISTLDALFSRMATGLHLDVGLPPGWRIADDSTVLRMRESALRVLVGRHGESELGTLVRLLSKGDVGRKVFDSIHDSVRSHRLLWLESDPDAWEWSFRKTLSHDGVLEAIDRLRSLPPQKNGHVRNALATFLKRV